MTEIVETEIVTSKGVEIVEKGGYKVKPSLSSTRKQRTFSILDMACRMPVHGSLGRNGSIPASRSELEKAPWNAQQDEASYQLPSSRR